MRDKMVSWIVALLIIGGLLTMILVDGPWRYDPVTEPGACEAGVTCENFP